MSPERFQQVDKILVDALEVPPEERAAFLDERCAGDHELRAEVESLLAHDEQAADFIETPAVDLTDKLVGRQLGPYKVMSKIGEGGMGVVYLAKDTKLPRQVALKVLPPHLTKDYNRLRRFEQEARAASSLNHPNILTIYSVDQADGRHYIASEFVDGLTLRDKMSGQDEAGGGLTLPEVVNAAAQVAEALAEAHAAGIVHRDIKPENIMIRRDGYVKVLDFGIAKLFGRRAADLAAGSPVHTVPNAVIGTPGYMSPEQARGLAVDARSDVWSLGAVLYEMLAGRPTFDGPTKTDIIAAVLSRDPAPIGRASANIPVELERMVKKALSKEPSARYQSIKDMAADLRQIQRKVEDGAGRRVDIGGDVKSRRKISTEELIQGVKSHKKSALAIVTSVVLVAVIGLYFASNSQAMTSIAVLPFGSDNAGEASEVLKDSMTDLLSYRLQYIPGLKVVSTRSLSKLTAQAADPKAAGNELGVSTILTGTVNRQEDHLFVVVRLVNTRDGSTLWQEEYRRSSSDTLATQAEILREVVRNLKLSLTPEAERRLAKLPTKDPRAADKYDYGRAYWQKRTKEGFYKGIENFNEAIALDPNYAEAYTGLAECYLFLSEWGMLPPREGMPKAKEAAEKALQIDPGLSEAHAAMARIREIYDWDWADARREYETAIRLNDNNAYAHVWYGRFLSIRQEVDQAVEEVEKAAQLDKHITILWEKGMPYLYSQQCAKALEKFQEAVSMNENFWPIYISISSAYSCQKDYQAALEAVEKAKKIAGDTLELKKVTAGIYAEMGRRDEARKILEELERRAEQERVPPDYLAGLYLQLGDKEKALEGLEKAYEERSNSMEYLNMPGAFAELRSDPRFIRLLQKVGHIN